GSTLLQDAAGRRTVAGRLLPRAVPRALDAVPSTRFQEIPMFLNRTLRAAVPVALAAVTALGLNLSAAPSASANVNDGYVSGSGAFGDDWDDEGTLGQGYPATYSNATCLWQKVLYADGYLSTAQVDGVFGSTTWAATYNWQHDR